MLGRKNKRLHGNKGNAKSGKFQQKPIKERLGKRFNDEEIESGSEGDNFNKDDFFEIEDEEKTDKKKNRKTNETADEKRLRLAKKFIKDIGDDVANKDNSDNDIDDTNRVDDIIREKIKIEKLEHHIELSTQANFNPVETNFFKGHKSSITCLDVSFDSLKAISCSKDTRAIQWDLNTGKKHLLPIFTTKPLYACTYFADDKIALFGGADKHVHTMDLRSEKIIQSFKAHNDAVIGILFDSNKDQYYTASKDSTLKVWALTSSNISMMLETFYGHTESINDMDTMSGYLKINDNSDFSGKAVNRVLTCGNDYGINLWKIDTQSYLQYKLIDEIYQTDCIKALNNEYFATGMYSGDICLWKSNKKKPMFRLTAAHGSRKTTTINGKYFANANSDDEITSVEDIKVNSNFPILSLCSIKNSDVVFSASTNGNFNVYRYDQKNCKISKIKEIPLMQKSCVNAIKVNRSNEFALLAHGKDSRLGRWDSENKAKNGISIIKLFD